MYYSLKQVTCIKLLAQHTCLLVLAHTCHQCRHCRCSRISAAIVAVAIANLIIANANNIIANANNIVIFIISQNIVSSPSIIRTLLIELL